MGKWQEKLERMLAGPVPRVDPMERIRKHNREVLGLTEYGGQRREWTTVPDKVSACEPWKPSSADRIAEELRTQERQRSVWDGWESMDDIVRRQDETR